MWLAGGTIYSNTSSYGGGVHVSQGQLALLDGTIAENRAQDGGGVHINYGGSALTQTGGAVVGNTATRHGGGVYVASGGVMLDGGQIVSNTAVQKGGGLYAELGAVTLQAGDVGYNTAKVGGGVYADLSLASWHQAGGNITGNSASSQGGGVFLNYARAMTAAQSRRTMQFPAAVCLSAAAAAFTQTGGVLWAILPIPAPVLC